MKDCNSNTKEAREVTSQVQGQSKLHKKTQSKKAKTSTRSK